MSENMPLVSVVLPVYNGEAFLNEALESLVEQTYTNWEAIIVDDCSTDSSPQIAKSYVEKDARFRYYRNEQNKKLPASLNEGFSHANGLLYTWISDDNSFKPDALEVMVEYLERNQDIDLVYTDITRIDSSKQPVSFPRYPSNPRMIHVYNVVQACFLYRAAVDKRLSGYAEDLFLVEDYDFWLRASRYFKLHHIAGSYYLYRMHEGSLTAKKQASIRKKTHEVLRRELSSSDTTIAQKAMIVLGLLFNKARIVLKL